MRNVTLTRTQTTAEGTFGYFVTDTNLCLRSGELPWRNNATGLSCIPIGTYECVWALSPTKGSVYHVIKVPDRTDIEIHAANFMGDRTMGLRCDLHGCIALGTSVGPMNGQKALLCSRLAFVQFYDDLDEEDFVLTITDNFGSQR